MSSPDFIWPSSPFRIVLVDPKIPGNTGNIARLCAGTGSPLHLAGKLGFNITDAEVKRAGLDYWDAVEVTQHHSFDDFVEEHPNTGICLFSTKGEIEHTQAQFQPGDALVFGSETAGLSASIRSAYPNRVYRIPMISDHVRSINLSNAVAIVLYEALRQVQTT